MRYFRFGGRHADENIHRRKRVASMRKPPRKDREDMRRGASIASARICACLATRRMRELIPAPRAVKPNRCVVAHSATTSSAPVAAGWRLRLSRCFARSADAPPTLHSRVAFRRQTLYARARYGVQPCDRTSVARSCKAAAVPQCRCARSLAVLCAPPAVVRGSGTA